MSSNWLKIGHSSLPIWRNIVLQWLHEHKAPLTPAAADVAATNGHILCFSGSKTTFPQLITAHMVTFATIGRHLSVFTWLHAHQLAVVSASIMCGIIRTDRVEMLQTIRTQHSG